MFFKKFNTLETTKVFLKESGVATIYPLDVTPDGISWSQTFTEKTYKTKTIENQGFLRDKGVFKKANPASFSFTVPLTKENHSSKKVFDLLVGTPNNTLKTFTLWFIDLDKLIHIETCIITSGSIGVSSGEVITLSIQGQGGKLSAVTANTTSSSLANTTIDNIIRTNTVDFGSISSDLQFTYANISEPTSRTFLTLDQMNVSTIDNSNTANHTERALSFSVEVQNKVKWIPHQTLNGSINTTNTSNIIYPSQFTLTGQIVSGNLRQVLRAGVLEGFVSANALTGSLENQQFFEDTAFSFSILGKGGTATTASLGSTYGIKFQPSTNCVSYTSKIEPGPFWTSTQDWRVTGNNTAALSTFLTYTTA